MAISLLHFINQGEESFLLLQELQNSVTKLVSSNAFLFQVLGAKYKHELLVDHPFPDTAGSCGNFLLLTFFDRYVPSFHVMIR